MIIDMLSITGSSVLAGAINGKSGFALLLKQIEVKPNAPTIIYLDFAGIEFASGSYLRESVFEFKKYVRSSYTNFYPVVANARVEVEDDLLLLATARNDVIMSCTLKRGDGPTSPNLIGSLDPKQSMTLELVELSGETDANSLMKSHGELEKTKSTTAWNNRLSALAARGLVREFISGRSKKYRPLFLGDDCGG